MFFLLLRGEDDAKDDRGFRGFRGWVMGGVDSLGMGDAVPLLFGGGGCLLSRPGLPGLLLMVS